MGCVELVSSGFELALSSLERLRLAEQLQAVAVELLGGDRGVDHLRDGGAESVHCHVNRGLVPRCTTMQGDGEHFHTVAQVVDAAGEVVAASRRQLVTTEQLGGVAVGDDRDVDAVRAEGDDGAINGEVRALETTGVVVDAVERVVEHDQAVIHVLARRSEGSRLERRFDYMSTSTSCELTIRALESESCYTDVFLHRTCSHINIVMDAQGHTFEVTSFLSMDIVAHPTCVACTMTYIGYLGTLTCTHVSDDETLESDPSEHDANECLVTVHFYTVTPYPFHGALDFDPRMDLYQGGGDDTEHPMDTTRARVPFPSDTCYIYFIHTKVNLLLYTCWLVPFEDGILLDTPLVCMHTYCQSFTEDEEECEHLRTTTPSAREACKRTQKKKN
ncbi:gag-pol polyprotein [Hordeum vulgare]|nr:gag-pol polyprotein [Hordeum vulgare]